MGLTTLQEDAIGLAKENIAISALGAVGAGIGIGLGTSALIGAIKRRKSKRRKTRTSGKRGYSRRKAKRKKRYKYARTAGRKKDRSHKRIRMTKNGQPYIILASGKARFISKRSARTSRKRKGGKY